MFRACVMLAIALNALWPLPAQAEALQLYRTLAMKPQQVGEARLHWLTLQIYDATLYAPQGLWRPNGPFVLELTYLRSLNGERVAATGIDEMRRLGFADEARLAAWQTQLNGWFADIRPSTRLAGVRHADGSTSFVRDGSTVLGTIADPDFGRHFFQIWLSDASQRPDLARRLRGEV